jgi:hypothetical protein
MINIPLNQVPKLLGDLSFDDMETLRDFIKERLGYKVIRHGLPPLGEIYLSPNLEHILSLLALLSNDDLHALLDIVVLLYRALMPQESLRHGRGTLEAKMIPRPKLIDGEWTIVYFGPYAYLRIWATGGDWNRARKIPRSKYLGKAIGQAIYNQPPEVVEAIKERVLAAIDRGQLETVKAEIQAELEGKERIVAALRKA